MDKKKHHHPNNNNNNNYNVHVLLILQSSLELSEKNKPNKKTEKSRIKNQEYHITTYMWQESFGYFYKCQKERLINDVFLFCLSRNGHYRIARITNLERKNLCIL